MLEEKWKNKLFMPEKYARYFIQITDIKIQKLHDISEKEAINEGIEESRPLAFGWKNYVTPSRFFSKTKKYDGVPGAVMSFFSL